MKKNFSCVCAFILLCGISYTSLAQSAGEEYAIAESQLNNAFNLSKQMKEFDVGANQKIIKASNDAAGLYIHAMNADSALRSLSTYSAFECYLQIAERYFDARADSLSLIYALKALEIWPDMKSIDEQDIINGKSIIEKDITYKVKPITSHKGFIQEFYWARYLAMELYFAKEDNEKCLRYAITGADEGYRYGAYNVAFYCANYACIIYSLDNNFCFAAHYAASGIMNAALLPANYTPTGPDQADLTYMVNFLAKDASTKCIKKEDLEMASVGLTELNSAWGNFNGDFKPIAEACFNKKCRSFNFLYNMLRYSYEHKDTSEMVKWQLRIKKGKGFKPTEWGQLAKFYNAYGINDLYERALKKSKRQP